jgi:hypothetical protein
VARVVAVGQIINESERQTIEYLRDHLAYACTILHNLEIIDNKDIIDIGRVDSMRASQSFTRLIDTIAMWISQ